VIWVSDGEWPAPVGLIASAQRAREAGTRFHGVQMRRALEVLIMERQSEVKGVYPPFAQALIDRGVREGELKGKHDALLRLLARAGIALAEEDRARICACADPATLDRWLDNVLGAKTAADVFS
jgi:hypothetical protein